MTDMTVYVSTTEGLACFGDEFFDENEADKLIEFAKKLGYKVTKEVTTELFADSLNPLRRHQVRDIDWSNYRNILYVIKNRDKSDEEIVRGLHSEGSGFSITVKRGQIMTEYSNFLELDGKNVTEEKLIAVCKRIAGMFISNPSAMQDKIDELIDAGCTVGKSSGYPECQKGFHKGCYACPWNAACKKPIKNEIDVAKFNEVRGAKA